MVRSIVLPLYLGLSITWIGLFLGRLNPNSDQKLFETSVSRRGLIYPQVWKFNKTTLGTSKLASLILIVDLLITLCKHTCKLRSDTDWLVYYHYWIICQNQHWCFPIPKELVYVFALPKTLVNGVIRFPVGQHLKSTKVPRIYRMFVTHSSVFIENLTEVDNPALKQGARYTRFVNILTKVSSTGNVTLIINWYRRVKQWEEPWNEDKWFRT
jgi:hypothetical protein